MIRFPTRVLAIALAFSMVVVACGDDEPDSAPEPAAAPETTAAPEPAPADDAADAPDEAPEAAPSEDPTSLRIAAIFLNTADDTWSTSLVGALERVAAERPRGLDITSEIFENIAYADGERVLRQTAETGNFDMIIAHSTYSDAVYAVRDDFPEILWSFTGSGNEGRGGNAYWLDVLPHEAAYLTGVAAGRLNETGVIGAVAAFPFPNVNGPVNAFFEGARSVSPDIETRVTYIESWFDPAAAQEAGTALIEEGADSLYAASTFGTFQAALEADRAFAIGDLDDQEALAPEVVITSVLILWDPGLKVLVDEWWAHVTAGEPYDAPVDRIQFLMAEGGADIAPLNEALVPADVIAEVNDLREQVLSGDLVVEFNPGPVE